MKIEVNRTHWKKFISRNSRSLNYYDDCCKTSLFSPLTSHNVWCSYDDLMDCESLTRAVINRKHWLEMRERTVQSVDSRQKKWVSRVWWTWTEHLIQQTTDFWWERMKSRINRMIQKGFTHRIWKSHGWRDSLTNRMREEREDRKKRYKRRWDELKRTERITRRWGCSIKHHHHHRIMTHKMMWCFIPFLSILFSISKIPFIFFFVSFQPPHRCLFSSTFGCFSIQTMKLYSWYSLKMLLIHHGDEDAAHQASDY